MDRLLPVTINYMDEIEFQLSQQVGFSFPDLYLFLWIERGPKMAYDFSANTQVYLKLNDS